MSKIYLFLVLLSITLSFCGCNSSEKDNGMQHTQNNTKNNVNEEQCNSKEFEGYIGEINENSIGIVEIGRELPNLDDYIGYESQNIEQIVPQENQTTKTQMITHLYYNGNEVAYVEYNDDKSIKVLITYNPNLYLSNCLHVGSNVSDLKNEYQLLDVMLNNDDGMLYIQPINEPTIKFMLTPDNIINNDKINQSDGKTSIDNINPRGLITSIMVSK